LAAAAPEGDQTGVMLHHADIGSDEHEDVERLLTLLITQENARCVPLASLLADQTLAPSG
jgi:hypothetical protein